MSRQLGAAGLALIKDFEHCELVAYQKFPGEPWTIGWGHTAGVKPGDTCTQEQADAWLVEDCAAVVLWVDHHTPDDLTQNQFDALVSFGYNVGLGNEQHSTLIRDILAHQDAAAADEFLKWDHQGGKQVAGLTRRREAERALFLAA